MNNRLLTSLLFLLAIQPKESWAQTNLTVQIGNKNLRGNPSLYERFTIVAEFAHDSMQAGLNGDAMAVIAGDVAQVKMLAWEYNGPTHDFVLHPASVSASISTPFRKFTLEKPDDLRVRAATRIQRKMRESPVDAWKLALVEVGKMQAILDQTKEQPMVAADMSPTPLRRFFLALLRECCSSKGWEGCWDVRTASNAAREVYFQCSHQHGLMLLKNASPCCDDLTKRCLAHGADTWFNSHVRLRTDAWRDCLVKDAGKLEGWDSDGNFGAELLQVLIYLQEHYNASISNPGGLKKLMTGRIGNYTSGWDDKKRSGLEKLNEMLTSGLSDKKDAQTILGEMSLSEWENVFDALKLLYDAG